LIAQLGGYEVSSSLSDSARSGDHIWWVSDVRRFQQDFPSWVYTYDLRAMVMELIEVAKERYGNA
jgi:CDP-paratose 2-epimerase